MAKAVRMMEENLKLCDAVVFVLDARAPASSFNPRLADMVGAKPVLYILNKGDLADGGADMAASAMQKAGKSAVRIAATMPSSARALTAAMELLTAEKRARLTEKGVNKPLRFLVAGIPNTGKSTVINLLAGGRKAQVAARSSFWIRPGRCRPPSSIRRLRGGSPTSGA